MLTAQRLAGHTHLVPRTRPLLAGGTADMGRPFALDDYRAIVW
jgi:hypothetical protein